MRSLVKSTMTLDLAEYWHAYGIQNVNQLRMAGVLLYDKMWVPAFARTTEQEHREVTQGLSLPRRWESILASSCGFPPPQEREGQDSSGRPRRKLMCDGTDLRRVLQGMQSHAHQIGPGAPELQHIIGSPRSAHPDDGEVCQ